MRREFRDQLDAEHPTQNIAELTFNRSVASMIDIKHIREALDLMTERLNLLEKHQITMTQRLDELVGSVNMMMVDYMKSKHEIECDDEEDEHADNYRVCT